MKLEFTLLIVDDAPSNIEQAINTLRDHLEEKGFNLEEKVQKDFSDQDLNKLAQLKGQDYDLVMVDFNLGLEDMTGAEIARKIRRSLPFTDMVFYSSDSAANLLGKLAEHNVSGIFTATRQALDDALKGLADTVIGKAVDLNHMRGIAMAEAAEMDVLMEETLVRAFSSSNAKASAVADRTEAKLLDSVCKSKKKVQKRLGEGGMALVVRDGRLVPHTQKYWAVKRLANQLTDAPDEHLSTLESYGSEIISRRNLLAHAKEKRDDSGKIRLCSVAGNQDPVIIDEPWMDDYRRKLQKHRQALTDICGLIDRDLATGGIAEQPVED